MHFARLESSDRLQRVLRVLETGPKTTLQIIQEAGVCAVNSIVSELRANKYNILCQCVRKGVFKYTLLKGQTHESQPL